MQLTKQPETEVEYWEAIEGLGGFIWATEHDMGHGRILDTDGSVRREIAEARQISQRLVNELTNKFGVINPSDRAGIKPGQPVPPAPEGKTYYWDWYKKMKLQVYSKDYEAMICSACPFSRGLQYMVDLGGHVPCDIFPGVLYRLVPPHRCRMLDEVECGAVGLHTKIVEKVGMEGLKKFLKKEEELQAGV